MKTIVAVVVLQICSMFALASHVMAGEAVWIDVRSAEEYASGHVAPAINIPHEQIAEQIGALDLASDQDIRVYCRSGRRSGIALETLESMGYSNVTNVGGLEDAEKWLAEHAPEDAATE